MNFICATEIQTPDIENRHVVTREVGVGEGRTGSLELSETLIYRMDKQQGSTVGEGNYSQHPVINYNGEKYLRKECLSVYNRVTFLYRRDWHNIVHQLFNKKYFKK